MGCTNIRDRFGGGMGDDPPKGVCLNKIEKWYIFGAGGAENFEKLAFFGEKR